MYFIIINGLLAVFFLFLLIIGIKLKFWAYLPINIVGIIVVSTCLYLDLNNLLNPTNILLLFAVLIVVFISDIIFTFRDFKDDITEEEVKRHKRYLPTGSTNDHFKLIRDEKLIKSELDQHQTAPMQERIQALEIFRQGNEAFVNKQFKEALEKYDRSTSWKETSIGYLNQSGVLMKLGQYEDALVVAQKAAEIQPAFYEAYLNMGIALEKLKKFEDALSRYRTAASISPDEYEIWYCCATVLYKINKPEEAIEAYDKSIQINGRLYESWYYKGVCLQRIDKDAEALHCFKQVIKLHPNYSHAYYRSGNVLSKLDRNSEAIEMFEKAIKNNSEFVTAWNNLGLVLTKTGRLKDAIRCYERAVKINPDYYDSWLNMGLAQDNLGQYKKAYISYTHFLELAPGDMGKRIAITRKRVEEIKTKYKIKKVKIQRKTARHQKGNKQKTESQFSEEKY
jgi:tetratricopeptide (TPR) repeat protein